MSVIKLSGTLVIRTITGRNGDFRVGRLLTEIGEFAVKDAVLDQYDEGRYEGAFGISSIYASHYAASGRLVIEVRARLETIALSDVDASYQQQESMESDPLDEEKLVRPTEASVTEKTESNRKTDPVDDEVLFSTLWPLTDKVKLDPTVDRDKFRQQRDRLKELGYTFQAMGQVWIKQ